MDTVDEQEKTGGVQVISRAATILNLLGEHPEGLSLGKIAQASGLPRSTVQRIVGALSEVELTRTSAKAGVALGPAFLRLVSNTHTDLINTLRPRLEALAEMTGETVVLSRPTGKHLTVIHCAVADGELQVVPRLGFARPLYSTAAGRVLLSLKTNAEVMALFKDDFSPAPDFSIQTTRDLTAVLDDIRRAGISYDFGEMIEGVNTLAIGLETGIGQFSVSMPMPQGRYEKKHDHCLKKLAEFRIKLLKETGPA
ncbi:IclR family transcriptional regulator [Enterobacter hormaechei]|uniref:IclR family transcriptional regulator n=1 Tax=Enterobacter hormaechei TaxID=158836 RepID=UPI0034D20C2A